MLCYTLAILFLAFNLFAVESTPLQPKEPSSCRSCHQLVDGKINVHLVPHSHDDVGWLRTFTEYYYGDESKHLTSQADAGVQYIISSTVEALKANPDRKFIQVESAFFYKWWLKQSEEIRQDVIDLVNRGQLEIINGAWSMNDEAATNYQSTIDQFTWGFRILKHTIGECGTPKIGWQIDPFGHSREHASLLKQFGFEGMVVGRIDYRDKARRIANKSLDFIWKTSNNLDNSKLFTSMFPDFYVDEPGFHFDVLVGDSINDANLESKVQKFAFILDGYRKYYQTPNIMMPMGSDFTYQQAERNFENMDRLIKGFENHDTYNVFYSTPSCYIQAVQEYVANKSLILEEKIDDFFPYASQSDRYWTGYFTSRPTSKRFERTSNNILQSLKQLTTFSRINNNEYDSYTLDLRQAMGVVQHHDAITGTAKQAVADDYDRMLYNGIQQAEIAASAIIIDLLTKDDGQNIAASFSSCLLANISVCANSQKDSFLVAVQNPLSQTVTHYVRLPVDGENYKITGPDGEEKFDIFDPIHAFDYVTLASQISKKELIFAARDLPPLGIKLYHVQKVSGNEYKVFEDITAKDSSFGTETNGFTIDTTTGKLNSVTLRGVTETITQEFLYYSTTSSGAYLFRPSSNEAQPLTEKFSSTKFVRGNLVDEVLQVISDEVTQIIRVYKDNDEPYIEFDWLVGDLQYPKSGTGKEVITKFVVKDFNNDAIFYTDSNGREQIPRILNSRSDYQYNASEYPVTSNYYPITSKIVIKDETKKLEVAILNDRAQGGSSLSDGSIELMVHRRLTRDDSLGVDEVLNEVQFGRGLYARGQHFLTFGSTESNDAGISSAAFERDLAQKKLLAPWILIADATSKDLTLDNLNKNINFQFEGLTGSLPNNVHILTLEPWTDSYILRLEHFLENNEDKELSKPVAVDLNNLFVGFNITDIKETTLGANERLADDLNLETLKITLNPMQIRTFIITTDKNNAGGKQDSNKDDDNNGGNSAELISATSLVTFAVLFTLFN